MRTKILLVTVMTTLFSSSLSFAQNKWDKIEVTSQPVSGTVHMLMGSGGNIGVSIGDDGILIIDDQYAPLAKKIAVAIGDISNKQIKYIINTHYHGDHTGSNAYFKEV